MILNNRGYSGTQGILQSIIRSDVFNYATDACTNSPLCQHSDLSDSLFRYSSVAALH